ncbi:MAG: hypothetical protein ABDH66_02620 [Bacteroidia bacterium]
MIYLIILWLQLCGVPYDLYHQDSIWQEGPRTWKALARLHLREKFSGLPIRVRPLTKTGQPVILSLCHEGEVTHWRIAWNGDTLQWISQRPSSTWFRQHMLLLKGPRTWHRGRPPFKVIEIVIPLAQRPQLPTDSLWRYNSPWWDSLVLPWIQNIRLPAGRITALGLRIKYFLTGKLVYDEAYLYVQRHDQLSFDEEGYRATISKLPKAYRLRFLSLKETLPAYAYVVRIQDYYPSTLVEAQNWMHLLREKQNFPLPSNLLTIEKLEPVGLLP